MKVFKNVAYGPRADRDNLMDIYIPENTENFVTFINFHGGGIEHGSKEGAPSEKFIDENSVAIVRPNYSLYPRASYPDFIEDAAMCVAYVINHIAEYGGDKTKVVVGGSSAGGYIAMMLAFDGMYLSKYRIHPNHIAGWIFDAGQPTTHFNVLRERGIDTRAVIVDRAAPLYHIRNYSGLKPMLIFSSELDIPGRLEQTKLLITTLKIFGYPEENITFEYMEGYSHCKYTNDKIFADKVLKFIKEKVK